jgi:hypothetical protein
MPSGASTITWCGHGLTDESPLRPVTEHLASRTREQEPRFEGFRIVAAQGDTRALQLRAVVTRFSIQFGFIRATTRRGGVCSTRPDSTQRACPQ